MAGERLSGLDMAFLKLDDRTAPMNIGALMIFEPDHPVGVEKLVRLLSERMSGFPQFRQRLRSTALPPAAAEWVEDPQFQVEAHIRVCCLPPPGTRDQLTEYTASAMASQLNPARPLWEAHVITGLSDGRFAFLLKTHHAVTDGQGGVRLFSAMYDEPTALGNEGNALACDTATAPSATARSSAAGSTATGGPVAGAPVAWRLLPRPDQWLSAIPTLVAGPSLIAGQLVETSRRTTRELGIAASVLRRARLSAVSSVVGKPSLPGKQSETPPERRLTLVQLDPGAVRRVRQRHRVMTHEVVLAVLAGALRDWLDSGDRGLGGAAPRALIPVALRPDAAGPGQGPGNNLSGYLCDLPVSEPDPVRRLRAVRVAMERNKAAGPYRGAGAFPLLAHSLPAAVHHLVAPLAGRGANLLFDIVVSNIPGSNRTPRLAGAPMRELYGIVPLARGHGLSVAVTSGRDFIGIALHSDPTIQPGITALSRALPRALADLAPPPPPVPSPRAALPTESRPATTPPATPLPAAPAASDPSASTPSSLSVPSAAAPSNRRTSTRTER
ncbi:wax ester/triacylglycerol synthase family O-acyltransferase [Frankia sp. CiP1_Cm_nod2]|uniref:wax ester/triacylglycerol synthase family O-acyltransferase n=1 Tax=Frankia sp. CiP1_Cm_nod2 TaxID=2897161 RepID=UPI002023DAFC